MKLKLSSLLASCVILLNFPTINAAVIKGRVIDSDKEALPGASLTLLSLPDSTHSGLQVADVDGKFSFTSVKPGKYCLVASMTGMDDVNKKIDIKDSKTNIDLGDITLKENAITLKETVVTAVRTAVVAKQDTIEFNADSYRTATNANVNDLLKKLPGVEVGTDGSITSNGKTITKILINGKEFFDDDPQMASKNLPANMVDKVQVVDRKSDFTRLTGVDDGEEETVINLTVKKNMNNGWFGNVSAGYGINDRYAGNFVINNFHEGNQITILGGLNNINDRGFTDRGQGRFRDFGGSGGITTAQRLGLNFNVGKGDDFRVGGNILYSHSDRKSTRKSATQFLLKDSTSYQNSGSINNDDGHNINADLRLQWKIDKANTLDFRPRFSMNFRDSYSNDSSTLRAGDAAMSLVNNNKNYQRNKGKSFQTSGNLIFNHNFLSKPGRAFSVNAQYSFSDTKQKSITWSNIIYYLLHDEDQEIYRFLDNHNWANSVNGRLTWTEPLGNAAKGNFLTLSYNMSLQWNNANQYTYNLDFPPNGIPDAIPDLHLTPSSEQFVDSLSNSFRNTFFTQQLQVGYKKVTKALNLEAGLQFSPASSQSVNLINDAKSIPKRWVWNVAPYANVRWKINQTRSFRANYRARTSQPSMNQLQPVADVSNPLNIIIGNPELKPTFTQSVMLNFSDFNQAEQQSLMFMVNASYALNTIVSRTTSNQETGGRETTYSNENGNANIMFMGMITRPFRANSKFRFNARLMTRYAASPGYVNGDFNRSGNLTLSPSAGLTFSCDVFQTSFNPNYSLSNVTNSLPQQPNRRTQSFGFSYDASLYLPFGFDITTDLNFSTNSGYSTGYNINQWLWNAQLSYSFLSDKSLTLSVKAYDILHQKKNISRSVSASSIVDTEYNDLTRYVMFSLTWSFNSLKKKNKGPDGETDIYMPPGGGQRPGGDRQRQGPPPGGGGGRPF